MLHFIINPAARSNRGRHIWNSLVPILEAEGIAYEAHMTSYAGHATKYAAELTASGKPVTLVVLGGDGSVNETINGITYLDRCTLGYIPTGSGNDFARSLGISEKPKTALMDILQAKSIRPINIGVNEYGNSRRRFAISSGIGFDAGVCHGVDTSRMKKLLNQLRLGKLIYLVTALRQILFQPRVMLTLTIDGNEPVLLPKTLFGVGMNLPYEGGGYKFCPDAKYDDDLLDFFVAGNLSCLQFLFMMPWALSGKHLRFKNQARCFRGKKATLTIDKSLPVHADGELIPPLKSMTLCLEPEKLNLIVGDSRQ